MLPTLRNSVICKPPIIILGKGKMYSLFYQENPISNPQVCIINIGVISDYIYDFSLIIIPPNV